MDIDRWNGRNRRNASILLQKRRVQTGDDQFRSAGHIEVPVKGLDIIVNRVRAEMQPPRDLLLTVAGEQTFEGLLQARRKVLARALSWLCSGTSPPGRAGG